MDEKSLNIIIILVGSLIISGSVFFSSDQDPADIPVDTNNDTIQAPGELIFHSNISEVIELARAENKLIYFYVSSKTCHWCKRFESETLADERIIRLLTEHFVLFELDFSELGATANDLDIRGTPTSVFILPSGQEIPDSRISGFVDADSLYEQLNEIILDRD